MTSGGKSKGPSRDDKRRKYLSRTSSSAICGHIGLCNLGGKSATSAEDQDKTR